jgi:hypothetical protein
MPVRMQQASFIAEALGDAVNLSEKRESLEALKSDALLRRQSLDTGVRRQSAYFLGTAALSSEHDAP